MPRITRSRAKAKSNEEIPQNEEVEKTASEYEPEPQYDNSPPASHKKQRTKGKKTERISRDAVQRVSQQQTITLAPGVSKSTARQNYTPCAQHRHRGIPAYLPSELQTLRLLKEPSPFTNHDTIWTKSAANPNILKRVTRALSNNVGEGPLWELLEDRSWYRECVDGQKRPPVYRNITPGDRWGYLNRQEAACYLPASFAAHDTGLQCYIGPFDNQVKHHFAPLQHLSLNDVFPEKMSHVFYAGGPVWAIDWCPMMSDASAREKQYLAVGPVPSNAFSANVGKPVLRPSPACIQIWCLSPSKPDDPSRDPGIVSCPLVLCIDCGPALDLKWCPLPAHDEHSSVTSLKKIGLLGGVFEDGSVSFYTIPDPDSLPNKQQGSEPFYVKLDPCLRIELPHTTCLSLDWANSGLIAIGCSNGHIAIYQVKRALEDSSYKLHPSHYFPVHQSAIRSIAWVKAPSQTAPGSSHSNTDPTVVLSGGYDGALMATDIRDLRGNIVYRTRDVISSIGFSHHIGFLASDNENAVKGFGITPSLLGRGHALIDLDGPVWSVGTSDFHPQLSVASADGTCRTTNIVKSTRRGGSVPFFIHKIYQLDYNRLTGEFRLLDNILPYEYLERSVVARPATKKAASEPVSSSSGAWSPEVSVTRVVWNSSGGIARSPWLASATASGLCRLDWLLGRFGNDRIPYGNIQSLRGDVEMDEIDELEDDDDNDDD